MSTHLPDTQGSNASARVREAPRCRFNIRDRQASPSATRYSAPHSHTPAEDINTNMWKPTLLLAVALALPTQALHFYLDGAVQKCFYEELPKDTLVVGTTYSSHISLFWGYVYNARVTAADRYRPLPRRSLERPDQIIPRQHRCRRLRHRRRDIRQQPPHCGPARQATRPLHLQRCRFRPASHLRHPSECALGRRLVRHRRSRHRQVHSGYGYWRDEQD